MTVPALDNWGIQERDCDRAAPFYALGLTDRQARFLVLVMRHAGVFLERQYCAFTGTAHGQNSHDFLAQLVARGFVREVQPGARHQGRLYHVHQKRLYRILEEPDNRHRRRMTTGKMIEQVMLLDGVMADPERLWLAGERDKVRYFLTRTTDGRLTHAELPSIVFGQQAGRTRRYFPDHLPIGLRPDGDGYVFLYLLTRPSPVDFRAFLRRHRRLLPRLYEWRVRVLVPQHLTRAIATYQHVFREEFGRPLPPHQTDELEWYFKQRKAVDEGASRPLDLRFDDAEQRFRGRRFRGLYEQWLREGDPMLWDLHSTLIADKLERGEAGIEFAILPHQYLHLAHLVGVA